MKIGIIGAMEQEVAILKEQIEGLTTTIKAGCTFHTGTLAGADIVLLQSGIGKVAAAVGTTLLISDHNVDLVLNTGSAGGFDSSLNSASDWDLWLKLAQIGDVAFTKEKAMGYLIRAGSMTSNKGNRIKAMETIVERHAAAATDEFGGAFSFAKARLADGYREMYIAQRQPLRSLQYSIKALCHVPSSTHVKSVLSDVVQLFKGKPATR